jgi:hypothetical protein
MNGNKADTLVLVQLSRLEDTHFWGHHSMSSWGAKRFYIDERE